MTEPSAEARERAKWLVADAATHDGALPEEGDTMVATAMAEITMPKDEADRKFREYRAAVRARFTEEDEVLRRAYYELARARRVIDLYAAMRTAGVDVQGRPRLAITRADATMVHCDVGVGGGAAFCTDDWLRRNAAPSRRILIPRRTFPVRASGIRCQARVPLIPPRFRPKGPLGGYRLLWEAEWVTLPVDPILLRPLGKNLYVVVARWDLTPLEQAVLGARS